MLLCLYNQKYIYKSSIELDCLKNCIEAMLGIRGAANSLVLLILLLLLLLVDMIAYKDQLK